MSIEVLVFIAAGLIAAAVLYARKHPAVITDLQARIAALEGRHAAPVAAISGEVSTFALPPAVDHAAIVTAAINGAAQIVATTQGAATSTPNAVQVTVDTTAPARIGGSAPPPAPSGPVVFDPALGIEAFRKLRDSLPPFTEIVSPRGYQIDVRGQEIGPDTTADFGGSDLWRKGAEWKCQLDAGKSDSRNFTVPAGWTGTVEYVGDQAAKEGDFRVLLDGQPLIGAGQQVYLAEGPHTLSAFCASPLSVGRTFATANLSIVHNP